MKTKLMRAVSLALCVCMLTTMFAGCGGSKKEVEEATAVAVDYKTDGSYTTTITSEKTKLSGVTANDISIVYSVFDFEGYSAAKAANGEEPDEAEYSTEKTAAISSVTENDDHSLTVSFTDAEAASNVTEYYEARIESKNIMATVGVTFAQYTLTPSVESVSAFDKEIRLTLELSESNFAENVTKEHITLAGAFQNMSIDSISSSGKNLTMQLTGDMLKDESSNSYLDAAVTVGKEAIVNASVPVRAAIPVDLVSVGFDSEKMTAANNMVSVPLEIKGYRFSDAVKASDITIEGTTVTALEKASDSTVKLTLTVNGAANKNSAAKALNEKKVTISAAATGSSEPLSVEANFGSASFYPVFDYAEVKDGKFVITLVLYANSGKFADTLKNDMIEFADGFEGASVTSIKRDSDTTATLILSVNADGKPVEEMELDGTVTLKAGALINRWGDTMDERCTVTRSYSQGSMGKDLTGGDLDLIKGIVGGFGNTTMGTVFGVGNGLLSAGTGIYSVLEMVGVIESEKAKLDKIYNAVRALDNKITGIQNSLNDFIDTTARNRLTDFYQREVLMLNSYKKKSVDVISDAKEDLKKAGIKEPAQALKNGEPVTAEWKAYFRKVYAKVIAKGDRDTFERLEEYYKMVVNRFIAYGSNPMMLDEFDTYMTKCYNFDTSAYDDREAFRIDILLHLSEASAALYSYYAYQEETRTSTLKGIDDDYAKVKNIFKTKAVVRRTDGRTHVYVLGASTTTAKSWEKDFYRFNNKAIHNCIGTNALDFTDPQIDEFIKRMQGRTMAEELAKAGITYNPDISGFVESKYFWLDKKVRGMAFYCYKGKWQYGAYYIPFDSNKIVQKSTGIVGWSDKKTHAEYLDDIPKKNRTLEGVEKSNSIVNFYVMVW